MDYKTIYLNTFNKKIEEIDSDIISLVKTFKKRNKNFTAKANQITKDLLAKEEDMKISVHHNFPDIFQKYTNRFNEYGSDHLTSFFEYDFPDLSNTYSESSLKQCAGELGAYQGHSRAVVNFPNSRIFLEAIYVLGKNYECYTLNFDPNNSPENSALFYEMQRERFSGYGQEPNLVDEALLEIKKEELKEQKNPEAREQLKGNYLKPGSVFNKPEKRYILHLLYQLLSQGSEMKATEFMRILHLTTDIIDPTVDINESPPHYRQVHEGFSKNYPKNKKLELIKRVISKTQEYQLPMLKQILNDKLIATTKKK